ncbi:uncharacterized protein BDR25DRAFT_278650 [Lindgomyces ingoldianus]|uniref:Uncharacterized protein n=1 Tax=Lindgomyces ingoldianus TaxID=673940 RepID=A0ACB6RBK2_9PLEO|nr:uncharacterized protein BDR25DRAFT_278650 [Lindgomyces ingoldianus]KAF2475902.1 hypothetical protein BDR25DRAFT_278650 [Lindgomyces ingoldianus]
MAQNDPKYQIGAEQARQNMMVGISIAMTSIGAIVVGFRLFTRSLIVGRLFADDWAMVTTMVFSFAYLLEVLIGAKSFKAGFSGAQLSVSDMQGILKITTAIVVTYKMTLTMIKVSILCFYLRLAVRRTFEQLCQYTLVLVVVFQVVVTAVTIGQCVPMNKLWDFTGAVNGKCINTNIFYHFASVFHIVTDIWILILPYQIVTRIARPWHEKLSLIAIFGLGIFSIAAAITRLSFLHIFTESKDPFYDSLPINIWSMVEVNTSIICASLPTLKPLISRSQRSRTREVNGYTGKSDAATHGSNGTEMSITKETRMDVSFTESLRPPVPPKSSHSDWDFDSSMDVFRAAKRIEAQFV